MQVARFDQIKQRFDIKDDELYFYTVEKDGTLKLLKVNEYEILVSDSLKEVYDDEPDGLWEQCLES